MSALISPGIAALLAVLMAAPCAGADWQLALPGWHYEFPRDHFIHAGFKTEWWYFTGRLMDERGNRFGYQLTFFRQGLRSPAQQHGERSRFLVNDSKFAHFAITDLSRGQFHFSAEDQQGCIWRGGIWRRVFGISPEAGVD